MAWYNIIALVIGILNLVWIIVIYTNNIHSRSTVFHRAAGCYWIFQIFLLAALFYGIWGGVFWW